MFIGGLIFVGKVIEIGEFVVFDVVFCVDWYGVECWYWLCFMWFDCSGWSFWSRGCILFLFFFVVIVCVDLYVE